MVADLEKWGVVPRKTFTLPWPSLPGELMRHYLRGYFDGDGCFRWSSINSYAFWLVGNDLFLEGCRDYLARHCSLPSPGLYHNRHGSKIGHLVYGGNRQVLRIYRLMYEDATIFLERKQVIGASIRLSPRYTDHEHRQQERHKIWLKQSHRYNPPTTCIHGHLWRQETTYYHFGRKGQIHRQCLECRRICMDRYQSRPQTP
jgi:hypothetical protein